jgi:hypothetical protein
MGNLSSSPFPKKQSIKSKPKVVQPEVGGEGEEPVDLSPEQAQVFLEQIDNLRNQIVSAQATQAPVATPATGGKTVKRSLRIKFT